MTNWPDKTLIRIVRGREYDEPVSDVLAARSGDDEYLLATGPRAGNSILHKASSDDIDEWEEVTAVPTAALKRLQGAFRGVDVIESLEPPLLEVISYLPADKPSALDQAVTRAINVGGPFCHAETIPAERLSILLDALASVHGTTRKAVPLAIIARICADWIQADNPEKESLEQMRNSAASIPEVVGSDAARFIVLAGYIGDAANALSEAHLDVSGQLTNAGVYALSWAAQIIEEEDK